MYRWAPKTLSSHWNRKEGSKLNLYTYTNGDEVELIVNGKSLGRRTNNVANPKEHNRIYWKDVPYAKGNIVARAYRKGENKPIATHRIETAGKAVNSRLQATTATGKQMQPTCNTYVSRHLTAGTVVTMAHSTKSNSQSTARLKSLVLSTATFQATNSP